MSCNICFSDEPINPISTPCKHVFCYNCIKEWIGRKQNCPCCRRDFTFEEVLNYYCKYSDKIITRSKTILLRKTIIMNNTQKNLKNLMLESNQERKIIKACDAFRYVYKHKAAFNSLDEKGIFLKTVLRKAMEFCYEGKINIFYEWVFKLRNYISLIDKDFDINKLKNYYSLNTNVIIGNIYQV
jgi:hypothetical protein